METLNQGFNLTIPVNNFHLSYDDVGEGSTPIICLHGFPFDKTMWKGQLDFLESKNRIIACDIRGFGKSTDETSYLSIDLFSEDLIAFMDALNIDKAIICGLSMGGFIALNALKRFPDRFEALILCDTQCIADSLEVHEKRYEIIDEINTNGVANFNEGFIKSVFHKDSITNKKELVEKLRGVVFANSENIIKKGLVALAERSETCSTLNEIAIPTLIICGSEDEVTPLVQSESMLSTIKDSILHVIHNAGHVSNLEQSQEFNEQLLNFLIFLNDLNFKKNNGEKRIV
ncbi:alpha/beta fold hydrolase [Sediminibacterium sp.]|uniref:alpha/beta fold hydrolase n=1 Tax=Sediminibacterium sp. TaxID=1917865 RepID=UPI002735F809|nr:alpha/beta hydrolase [Sediminibacterium sp.]MDP3394994.1 alpha/beta hydrolase [Sediminibacterium sp.]MDP3565620.1 alpha/beta hydrolase [Sediminibacterium sp.]